MMLNRVGQHAQKHVCCKAILGAMLNQTYVQRDAFHRTARQLNRGNTVVVGKKLGRLRLWF